MQAMPNIMTDTLAKVIIICIPILTKYEKNVHLKFGNIWDVFFSAKPNEEMIHLAKVSNRKQQRGTIRAGL